MPKDVEMEYDPETGQIKVRMQYMVLPGRGIVFVDTSERDNETNHERRDLESRRSDFG